MTAFDLFDPFEQQISTALGEIAPARRPDYLDDILRHTARTSQRPRWSFPGRWLPMEMTLTPVRAGRTSLRLLVLLALVALLAIAATAILAGSRRPTLLPVGPAANGALVYPRGGDLYLRDSLAPDAKTRPIITGSAKQSGPYLSPDGQTFVYAETGVGGDYLWASALDGSNHRQLLSDPIADGWSQWSWALDSKHLLVSGVIRGEPRLYDVAADGKGTREIVLDGLVAWDAFWSPVDPNTFLLRAQSKSGLEAMDLYLASADGTNLRALGLQGQTAFGPHYTLSGAAWSPDGKTIAYNFIGLSEKPGSVTTHFRVHLVNPDGSNDRPLPGPNDARINEGWPRYSPDGTQLLVQHFIFSSDQTTTDGSGWMAVLPADGSAPARDIGPRIENTTDTDVWADWSPDGTSVLEGISETKKSYAVDSLTGKATELPWTDDTPAWQRKAP